MNVRIKVILNVTVKVTVKIRANPWVRLNI
jgi:hypothetical protein